LDCDLSYSKGKLNGGAGKTRPLSAASQQGVKSQVTKLSVLQE